MDKNHVAYYVYYQKTPFDFENDPDLSEAVCKEILPDVGDGYENGVGPDVYPNQTTITGLESEETYYFVIRARDKSENHNEEKNQTVISCITK